MRPPTPRAPGSSPESGAALVLRPEPSRWLALWWCAVHALAAAAVLASAVPALPAAAALAALFAHAWLRRPGPPVRLERSREGGWALPAEGLRGFVLAPGSAVGPFWVHLRLEGPGGRRAVLLLRDQLDPETWRGLQAELRRDGRGGGAH